jgi:CBS domain-containing protein
MSEKRVRRLAVVQDDGRLVGVLSLNDLARHAGHRLDELSTDEVAGTLHTICEPWTTRAASA